MIYQDVPTCVRTYNIYQQGSFVTVWIRFGCASVFQILSDFQISVSKNINKDAQLNIDLS